MSIKKGYTSVLYRRTRNDVFRTSHLSIGWPEQVQQMHQLAQEDHTYHATEEERERYKHIWVLQSTQQIDIRNKAIVFFIRIAVQLFKKDTKC